MLSRMTRNLIGKIHLAMQRYLLTLP